jgi:hypothetical protein
MRGKCWPLLLVLLLSLPRWAWTDTVCDGIDDIMTSTAGSNFITVSDGTVFMTVKHAGSPDSGAVCGRDILLGQASNSIWELGAEGDVNSWVAKNFDGSSDCAFGTFSTAWTTLVWRHTGGNVELYINGALAQSTASGDATTLTHNLTVCWNGTTADAQAPITVAQVAFYNTGLSANQIAAYGNSFVRGLLPSGATAVWDFQGCAHGASVDATVFPDRTGNGRTITADNGANNTGMSCAGSTGMALMGGIQ